MLLTVLLPGVETIQCLTTNFLSGLGKATLRQVPIREIVWRRYVLSTSAFHCIQLEGDFVECGAYTGVGVKRIVDYLSGIDLPKQFWAYDVFKHQRDDNHPVPAVSPKLFDRVKQKFSDYARVIIIQRHIPESFVNNCPEKSLNFTLIATKRHQR